MNAGTISRWVLAHKKLVVIAWVAITIFAIATVSNAVGALSEDYSVPGGEGSAANAEITEIYGNGGAVPPLVPVVALPEGVTIDTPGVAEELDALFAKVTAASPNIRVASYGSDGDRAFASDDGRTTFGLIYTPIGSGFAPSTEYLAAKDVLEGATIAGAPVILTGWTELELNGEAAEESGVLVETLIGAFGALIILIWVFGSFLALLPLVMAAVSILTTFTAIWLLTTVIDVSFIVQFLVALIGLGVAIDYVLLVVTRWREERAAGYENEEAVQRAMETAGTAVVFSGTTVAVGLFALVVLPVPFLRSIGYGGMLIPLVSVLVALTLLPVMLSTIGPRIDWPRRRRGSQESRFWGRWAQMIVRRRWVAAAVGLAIMAILLIPATRMVIGDPVASSLSTGGVAQDGLDLLERSGIGAGVLQPYETLVDGDDPSAAQGELAAVEGVRAVTAPTGDQWRRDGTSLMSVMASTDTNTDEGQATLERVRETAAGLQGVQVGGQAAESQDFIDAIYENFWLMLVLIAVVTFVLLARAFRSIVLPAKAIVLNFISVGAAFGIMTWMWQEGNLTGRIWGYEPTGSIVSFIPLMVFAFLFGLSMDYEVFILARMREEYDAVGDTDRAVVRGIANTGRLVTSAALILFFAFAALGSGPEVILKTFATGLAAGILLDATIVRSVLVPATVSLFGRWNWWLPAWLERFMPKATPIHGGPAAPAVQMGAEAD